MTDRPRIFGNETKFIKALSRYVESGRELLDFGEGVQERLDASPTGPDGILARVIEAEWARKVEKWRVTVLRGVDDYLATQVPVLLPTLALPLPPDTGKPRHRRTIQLVREWLTSALAEIGELLQLGSTSEESNRGQARSISKTGPRAVTRKRRSGQTAAPRQELRPSIKQPANYDVALSFAGEQRQYVEAVAHILQTRGTKVFYDKYEAAALLGANLFDRLAEVYEKRARFVAIFASAAYASKAWPNHERQSAQARAIAQQEVYVLPARFDDTEIPGIPNTVSYVDLRVTSPEELADLVAEKLRL